MGNKKLPAEETQPQSPEGPESAEPTFPDNNVQTSSSRSNVVTSSREKSEKSVPSSSSNSKELNTYLMTVGDQFDVLDQSNRWCEAEVCFLFFLFLYFL